MKRKSQPVAQANALSGKARPAVSAGGRDGRPPSPRRRWGFRVAALLLPVALLGAAEVGLRLFGFGYSTRLFLASRLQGKAVLIENPAFTRRFFPPGLERTPEPLALAATKPPDTCRIFVFGESAAQGDPEPAFGFVRILERLLGARFPTTRFEVVNVAITAINSHVIRCLARDCAPRQGDVWILYMGNNEVVGPFGAGTVFGAQAPGRGLIRASLALKRTRLGQACDSLRWQWARGSAPSAWEGMEMFLDQQVRRDDPRLAVVYEHFQHNLHALLQLAQSAGAKVLLSTVASNLKDCPPFASLHRPDLAATDLAAWNGHFQAGTNQAASGNFSAALTHFQQAARLDDQFAELWFRVGRCQQALGNVTAARANLERARDLDTLRFRADTRINEIIRHAADGQPGTDLRLVDAVTLFARNSPADLPGEELLHDHVHPNYDGHYLLARAFAEAIISLLPPAMTRSATNAAPWLSAGDCGRRLAYTAWDRTQIFEQMYQRLQLPPFTHQVGHAAHLERWRERRALANAALDAPAMQASAAMYRAALALAPNDWCLHARFARLQQEGGDPAVAEQHWHRVVELMPHYLESYYSLGTLLDSRGRSLEAIAWFEAALRRQPGLVEARNGLGLAYANLGQVQAAIRQYELALRRRPEFADAHVNLGQILAQQGRLEDARNQYALALRYQSNSAAAHINLGKLLASEGQVREAALHYRTAVALKPENAIAHYNLGNALTALNDPAAFDHYLQAARLQPDFVEARYRVGLGWARQGNAAEAATEFAAVVRLRPESAEAWLNLGVALAKLGRYAEAITNFQAVLRCDPDNAIAKQYLEQATARSR